MSDAKEIENASAFVPLQADSTPLAVHARQGACFDRTIGMNPIWSMIHILDDRMG